MGEERVSDVYSSLNDLILGLLDENVFQLVEKSHQEAVWSTRKEEIFMGVGRHEYMLQEVVL